MEQKLLIYSGQWATIFQVGRYIIAYVVKTRSTDLAVGY